MYKMQKDSRQIIGNKPRITKGELIMTPEEYQSRLEALKKQELELAQEFVKDNPFKELEGKWINVTIGFSQKKVLYVGAGFTKNTFEPALFYHEMKKDGNPRKNCSYILARFYNGKTYKIKKLCRR